MSAPVVAHLVLVGLPGAGKSTVGHRAAAVLGWPFVDLDEEIERREGRSVAELFAERGEGYFRERELAATAELRAAGTSSVVAPGGGWVTVPGAVALLRPPGRIIHLAVSPERALARLGGSRQSRPLLRRPDPLAALESLLSARQQAYEACSDHVVRTDLLTVQQVTDAVVELASTFREA
ncbi:MAG TPA: shikimate kinase [Gemmatimonadaceae bacterium]|nr:shikimate kinase [Gemmatimonadaceae bacterium]